MNGDEPTAEERYYLARIARLECVLCARDWHSDDHAAEIHHVAEGSGLRSYFACVKLCAWHHRGPNGIHGREGTKGFVRRYRPPGDSEYGLLVWQNEDLAKFDRLRAIAP